MTTGHAYLIMAHNHFDVLEYLIMLLDDERNDIYLHVDKKSREFDADRFRHLPTRSTLYLLPRINVNWGSYSQIQCELNLLKAATERGYAYYHLLSGADLPLKSQSEIHATFDRFAGLEFIHFSDVSGEDISSRVSRFHLLQEYENRAGRNVLFKVAHLVNKALLLAQEFIGFDRLGRLHVPLRSGSTWFSISDSLAKHIVSKEDWIRSHFSYSLCGDEVFLQTLVFSSAFRDRLSQHLLGNGYLSSLRKIDWDRDAHARSPYVWRSSDFDDLIGSEYLFARKFDQDVDRPIIERLFHHVNNLQRSSRNDSPA